MSRHQQVLEWLPFYVKGKLSLPESQLVEQHLVDCADCQGALTDWRTISQALQQQLQQSQQGLSLPPLKLPTISTLPVTEHLPRATKQSWLTLRGFPETHERKATKMKDSNHLNNGVTGRRWYRTFTNTLLVVSVLALVLIGVAVLSRSYQPAQQTADTGGAVVGSQPKPTAPPPTPTPAMATASLVTGPTLTAVGPITGTTFITSTIGISGTVIISGGVAVYGTISGTIPITGAVPVTGTTLTAVGTLAPIPFTGQQINSFNFKAGTNTFTALSPTKQYLAISAEGVVQLWTPGTGKVVTTIPVPKEFASNVIWADIAWSSDGQTLAIAYYFHTPSAANQVGGQVVLLTAASNFQTGTTLENLTSEIYSFAWSPDGKYLAVVSGDSTAKGNSISLSLWGADGKLARTLLKNQTMLPNNIAWSPDAGLLAATWEQGESANGGTLQFWSANGDLVNSFDIAAGSFNNIAWSPDGQWLAAGVAANKDNLLVYNRQKVTSKAANPYVNLTGHTDFVVGLSWSFDGQTLASSSSDKTVRLWDVSKASTLATVPVAQLALALDWSFDGSKLAISNNDNSVEIVDRTGKTVNTLQTTGNITQLYWGSPVATLFTKDATVAVGIGTTEGGYAVAGSPEAGLTTGTTTTQSTFTTTTFGSDLITVSDKGVIQIWR